MNQPKVSEKLAQAGDQLLILNTIRNFLLENKIDLAKTYGEFNKLNFEDLDDVNKQIANLTPQVGTSTNNVAADTSYNRNQVEDDSGFSETKFNTGVRRYREDLTYSKLTISKAKGIAIAETLELDGYISQEYLREAFIDNFSSLNGRVFTGEDVYRTDTGRATAKSINTWMIIADDPAHPMILEINAFKKNSPNRLNNQNNVIENCGTFISCINPLTGEKIFTFQVDPIFDPKTFQKFPDSDIYQFNTESIARRLKGSNAGKLNPSLFGYNCSDKELSRTSENYFNDDPENKDLPPDQKLTIYLSHQKTAHVSSENPFPDLSRFPSENVMQVFRKINWGNEIIKLRENDFYDLLKFSENCNGNYLDHTTLSDGNTEVYSCNSRSISASQGGLSGRSRKGNSGY